MMTQTTVTTAAAALALLLAAATPAAAIESITGGPVNMQAKIDFPKLDAKNFYEVLTPLAKAEGSVTFFDFSNSFEVIFRDHLIPGFEKQYGIKVSYQRGNGNAAAQQLIATFNAGAPAPFDVFFTGSGNVFTLGKTDIVANIPFFKLMPNGANLDEKVMTTTEGINHGGLYVMFHRNQTALTYNTRFMKEGTQPKDFASLLAWTKANPKRFAVTNPGKGGSGEGFMQSLAWALVKGDDCTKQLNDYAIAEPAAKAFANGPCMAPVWDYYKALLPNAEITNGNADTLNLIANAEAWIGTSWEDMVYDFSGRGLLPPSVRTYLLAEGEVGGGDGIFMPSRPVHPAAGMLFLDYLMGNEAQSAKLKINGSRTARLDIDTAKAFTAAQAARLIPSEQYAKLARPNIPRAISNAASTYFQENLLRK